MTRIEIIIDFDNDNEARRASKIMLYCYNRIYRLFQSAGAGHYFCMPEYK